MPVIEELYGLDKSSTKYYDISEAKQINCRKLNSLNDNNGSSKLLEKLTHFFCKVFLPQGYPDSVTGDYLEYQLWDTLQAFCSSIVGTLATEAVLKGVGVGDTAATPLAATITWLLKDGAGMLGRITFAYFKGSSLDADCKKWRFFADVLNDVSFFIDLMAPYFKPFFLYVICFSSVCRSIVGVAGGATRAAMTQHQALRGNLADVSAKDGSQETLVNLSALICSILMMPLVSGKMPLIWTLFVILTLCHVFTNYKAVKSLRMRNFNWKRFSYVVRNFLLQERAACIEEANLSEGIISDFVTSRTRPNIFLGCSHSMISEGQPKILRFLPQCQGQAFSIAVESSENDIKFKNFFGFLREGAESVDVLKLAFYIEFCILRGDFALETASMNSKFEMFLAEIQQVGWDTERLLLNCDDFRYTCRSESGKQ